METIKIFSKRLKEERMKKGLMQKEMAIILGMPSNTYNGYETSKRMPNMEIVKSISEYFDVSVDYLLGSTDNPKANIEKLTSKDKKDIAKDLASLLLKLESQEGLMFSGEPINETDRELILNALEMGMKIAKKENKKYTPNKYKSNK